MDDPVLKDLFGSWMALFPNKMRARPATLAGNQMTFSVVDHMETLRPRLSRGAPGFKSRWTVEPLFSNHEIAFFFASETTLKPTETGSYVDGTS